MPKAEVRCQNNPWARELRGVPTRYIPQVSVPPSLPLSLSTLDAAWQRRGLSSTTEADSLRTLVVTLCAGGMAASHASRSSSRTIVPTVAWQV